MTRSSTQWLVKVGCAACLAFAALAIASTFAMLDVGEETYSAGATIIAMARVAAIAALVGAVVGLFRPALAFKISLFTLIAALPIILAINIPRLWCFMDCPPGPVMFTIQSHGLTLPLSLVAAVLGFHRLKRI